MISQVVSFVRDLADLLPDYAIASEHEHSNCVLIAHTKVLTIRSINVNGLAGYIRSFDTTYSFVSMANGTLG